MKLHLPILTAVERAGMAGLREGANAIMRAARENAPKDSGDLAKSARVRVEDLYVQVSFDGPYAVLQHERTDWVHADGGSSKFLETAVDEVPWDQIAASRMRSELGG